MSFRRFFVLGILEEARLLGKDVKFVFGSSYVAGQAMTAHAMSRAVARHPLEPEYDGWKQTGKLYLYGGTPVLHSFAHGGRTFKLRRQPKRIKVRELAVTDLPGLNQV